jgi:hypothetical protein
MDKRLETVREYRKIKFSSKRQIIIPKTDHLAIEETFSIFIG